MDFRDRRTGEVVNTSFVKRRKAQVRADRFRDVGRQRHNAYVARQEAAHGKTVQPLDEEG